MVDLLLEELFARLGLPYPRPSKYSHEIARKYGYLPYMIERYAHIFKSQEELLDFLEMVERGIPRYIRCNTLAVKSCSELADRLRRAGVVVREVPWLPHAYRVESVGRRSSLGSTLEYLMGYYYIQGLGSMAASHALEPKPGERIADLAAAPGGKTTHIAQLMENRGVIVSVEKNPVRALSLMANIFRMRVRIAVVVVKDLLELDVKNAFDRVLLDAPCTGEGLLPIKKERKTSKGPEELAKMHEVQVGLLKKAVELVKPGGYLVYSTCSIAPEENEFVVNKVLSRVAGLRVEVISSLRVGEPGLTEFMGHKLSEELRLCVRLYPHKHSSEGFFICKLRKIHE